MSLTRTGSSSRTYVKFEKFHGDPSEANLEDTTVSSVQTQEQTVEQEDEEEDDRFSLYLVLYSLVIPSFCLTIGLSRNLVNQLDV